MIALIAIIIGIVGVDQLTKWLAVIYLQGEPSFPLWKDVLHFTYVQNPGMAFGMMQNNRWVFIVFSLVAVAAIVFYLFKFRPENRWFSTALCMIAGGGFGNMIDRLFYYEEGGSFGNGVVVDFLNFCAFPKLWHWIFNVADAFVVVGAGIMIVCLFLDIVNEDKEEQAAKKAKAEKAVSYGITFLPSVLTISQWTKSRLRL